MTKVDAYFTFIQELLQIGKNTEIYDLVSLPPPHQYIQKSDESYIDFLREELEKTQKIPVFNYSPWTSEHPKESLCTPSKICYYDQEGALTTKFVQDLGGLRASFFEIYEENIEVETPLVKNYPPVLINSFEPFLNFQEKKIQTNQISIFTHSDIWFPAVIGFHMEDFGQYDNRELAYCHTPRFNQFIQEIKKLTLSFGGKWKQAKLEGFSDNYDHFIKEEGILLH